MSAQWSKVGEKLGQQTGIQELMDDLGQAMAERRDLLMLGGGNPAAIPEVEAVWRRRMEELMADGRAFDEMLGNYDTPQGSPAFLRSVAAYFKEQHGWNIGPENVAVTNGSQTACFALFNLIAGGAVDGDRRRILLPLSPEYIGYADQGLEEDVFVSARPRIEEREGRQFKYRLDPENLPWSDDLAAVAVSRPTNPTGNVLTDDEMAYLSMECQKRELLFFIDNAYGAPFPSILFTDITPMWDEHIVLSLSLSKIGLPGTRTGIVIANKEVIASLSSMNAVLSLANGNVGQRLVQPMIESGELTRLAQDVVQPFYKKRMEQAVAAADELWPADVPWRLHVSEGALFLWLWCPGLPVTSRQLYARLKDRGVLVVSGHYFFYGLEEEWPHADECLRINYSQAPEVVREGFRIIGEELAKAYAE